ncbi:MAG: YceI family protein [Devosia sp.]
MPTTSAPPFRASRYTTGAIVLHWTIAILMILQIIGGLIMVDFLAQGSSLQFDAYQLHKSFGVTILALTVARILWRAFNPPPPLPADVKPLEAGIAHVVHLVFYFLLLAIPLSGWLMVTVSPFQVETLLFFQDWLPWPHIPGLDGLSEGTRDTLSEGSEWAHFILAYAAAGLIALHIAGALKHQMEHRGYLTRMSLFAKGDGPRNSYGHATTWIATVLFVGTIVGIGLFTRSDDTATAADAAPPAASTTSQGVSPDQATALASGAADAPASSPLASGTPTAASSVETHAEPDAPATADTSATTDTAQAPATDTPATDAPAASPAPTSDAAPASQPAATPAPAADPVSAQSHRWAMKPEESTLTFTVTNDGDSVTGTFGTFTTDIVFDPSNLEGSKIDVTIDTTSVSMSGSAISRGQINGSDGFANRQFGTATFTSSSIREDAGGYAADGTLTIRGVSHPQTLNFTLSIVGDLAEAKGTMTVSRLDYGLGADNDASAETLADEVTIDTDLTAIRATDAPPTPEPAQSAAQSTPALTDPTATRLAPSVDAAPQAPGPAAAPTPQLWTMIPDQSSLTFSFRNDGGEASGRFETFNTTIRFDENALEASSISAEIDLASATMSTRGITNAQLRGSDGLAARRYQTATFTTSSISSDGEGGFIAEGTLSLRGIDQAVTMPFSLDVQDGIGRAKGTVTLDRSAFDIGSENDAEGETLGLRVTVTVDIAASAPEQESDSAR